MPTSSTHDAITSSTRGERSEGDAGAPTGEDAGAQRAQSAAEGRTFGGLSPAEAARLRWAKERARKAEQEEHADEDGATPRLVLVPIRQRAVIAALEAKASTGDVQAARELRPWLDRVPQGEEDGVDFATLTKRERDYLAVRFLEELRQLEGESPAQGSNR